MQGVGHDDKGILVLGATNLPHAIDPACRRRLEKRIYIPLPDLNARKTLVKNCMAKTPHELTEEDFDEIANSTKGFSGSDLSILVRDACFNPLRKAQETNYFKIEPDGKYVACSPSDNGAQPLTMEQIEQRSLKLSRVSFVNYYFLGFFLIIFLGLG
jgi:vacuolar protein-sorting-associated protein 4